MYRTHTCGELRIADKGKTVELSGWVQKARKFGGMVFVDIRDRYGITQVFADEATDADLCEKLSKLGREYVVKICGTVAERSNKNEKIPTGEIEILVSSFNILNKSETPPFTIEDDTDGGEELRMKYRYLDLRRPEMRQKLELRHKLAKAVRDYLDKQGFLEVETPVLIKSTPEGARDFVVPSRMSQGQFYALPQSPQVFKQLLMVGGLDKYFQIVKCFRDEDFRSDRQPEFTQIDCEMAFVDQEDIISTFEGLAKYLLKESRGIEFSSDFPRLSYHEAMERYGSDKPDIRFSMEISDISLQAKGHSFPPFDQAEYIGAICAQGAGEYTRKQLDALTEFVKRPQIGATGLMYVKCNADGSFKSSADKFFGEEQIRPWADKLRAQPGDLILVLSGSRNKTLNALNELRLEMGSQLGLRNKDVFAPLWVLDFPLLEWNEDARRYHAMHHPFTSPKHEDMELIETDPGKARAIAYDFVINGNEIGGGSIRIYDQKLQDKMFSLLGFTAEQAQAQFGFLLNAFRYGAPPHGGIAFGLDRLAAILSGSESIRDVIAFPKNNAGRDLMIDSPSPLAPEQLAELSLAIEKQK
jgi:aspartyl-tRNA synthetase